MMPIRTPEAATMVDPRTFSQATVCPVSLSIRLAARSGKRASRARCFRAPRGSSWSVMGTGFGPAGPKSNSWLPMAAAATSSALYAATMLAPSTRFDSSVPCHMSPASTTSTAPPSPDLAARNALTWDAMATRPPDRSDALSWPCTSLMPTMEIVTISSRGACGEQASSASGTSDKKSIFFMRRF